MPGPQQLPDASRKFGRFLFALTVIILLVRLVPLTWSRFEKNDFTHYIVSSSLYFSGDQIYGRDLEDEFAKRGWLHDEEPVYRASNPPGLLALCGPLLLLPPQAAYVTWTLVQLTALGLVFYLVAKLLKGKIASDRLLLVYAAFLTLPILEMHFHYAQVQLLLMALILGAETLSRSGYHRTAILLIVLSGLLKIFPLVLLPWFVLRAGDWKHRVHAGLFAALAMGVGCVLLGTGTWIEFFKNGTREVALWAKSYPSYSIPSFFAKFGIFMTGSNSSELSNRLFGLGMMVALGSLVVVQLICCRLRNERNHELALLLLAMILCGTTCWLHYLVFLLFPLVVIATDDEWTAGPVPFVQLATVYCLLQINLAIQLESPATILLIRNLPFFALLLVTGALIRRMDWGQRDTRALAVGHERSGLPLQSTTMVTQD